MQLISQMNIAEMAFNVGHICGTLNMRIEQATPMAYEFGDYVLHFYDGYWNAQDEVWGVRKRNANGA